MCFGNWVNQSCTVGWKSSMSSWISCTTALRRLGRSCCRSCHAWMVDTNPGSGGPGCNPGCCRVRAVRQCWTQSLVGGMVKASLGQGPGPTEGFTAVVMASTVWRALWRGARWIGWLYCATAAVLQAFWRMRNIRNLATCRCQALAIILCLDLSITPLTLV